MNYLSIFLIVQNLIFFANILNVDANIIPDGITLCHHADSKCLKQTVQHILSNFGKTGVRALNILRFEPLRVNTLELKQNPTSPVSVDLKFIGIDIIGLQQAKLTKITGFDADIKQPIEIELQVPKVSLSGHYTIDGKVLILPIVGKGLSEINLNDVLIKARLQPKAVDKDGHIYMQIDSLKLDIMPKHVSYNLEGLFNGDKALGDNMNAFLNENWLDIFNELKSDLGVAFGLVLKHIVNEPFSKYAYEKYFLH